MILRKPQLQLAYQVKVENMESHKEYFLHAVTYFPNTAYVADGFKIHDSTGSDGSLQVELHFKEQNPEEVLNIITPVVHVVKLGTRPFNGSDEGRLVAMVVTKDNIQARNVEGGSQSETTSSDAQKDDRPGGL